MRLQGPPCLVLCPKEWGERLYFFGGWVLRLWSWLELHLGAYILGSHNRDQW
jgi:hypothetical protein